MSNIFTTFFYQPILNLLVFIYNIIPGHDLGLAIVFLTVIVKLALWPLSKQSIKSQKSLRDLQPKIEEIKKKYVDKKEEMARAMMELYKNNKVNPFSSCLPVLIQLPFLLAVFRVFRNGFNNGSLDLVYSFVGRPEVINNMFLGFMDLSQPSVFLAVLAGGSQFWQVKMMSTKKPPLKTPGAQDENMAAIMNKQMQYILPAMTILFGFSFPGGLMLYWFVSTVLTALQQLYMFKQKEKDNKVIEGEVVK